MRLIILCLALAACAIDPRELTVEQDSISGFCGNPPAQCDPRAVVVTGNSVCDTACRANGYPTGYCREYTDADIAWCQSSAHHVDRNGSYPGRCFQWYPSFVTQCIGGFLQ